MTEKKCFKCLEIKPITEFYRHPKTADGHLNKCKTCTKKDVGQHRLQNLEKVKAYDRQRGHDPRRKANNRVNYKKRTSTPEGKRKEWDRAASWIKANPLKRAAHVLVGNALRDGRLTRRPCQRCGTDKNVHAHHEDYEKPLEVTWLCKDCHGRRHQEINEEER